MCLYSRITMKIFQPDNMLKKNMIELLFSELYLVELHRKKTEE